MTRKLASEEVETEWRKKPGTEILPEHLVWMCEACGKTSLSRWGFDKGNNRVATMGYDESCAIHAALYRIDEEHNKPFESREVR
jgi:hypothetical protein